MIYLRYPKIILGFLFGLVFASALVFALEDDVLSKIELVSSYYEPGPGYQTGTDDLTAHGMAYLRYSVEFPSEDHTNLPFSVKVGLGAKTVPQKSLDEDYVETPSPGVVVTTQVNPFFNRHDDIPPSIYVSMATRHFVLGLENIDSTEGEETTAQEIESDSVDKILTESPTIRLSNGFHRTLSFNGDQEQFNKAGYNKKAHFITVALPINTVTFMQPFPTLPLPYSVTFGIEVPNDSPQGYSTILRTFNGKITSFTQPDIPEDISIRRENINSIWLIGGIDIHSKGNFHHISHFTQKWGYAFDISRAHSVSLSPEESTCEAYLYKSNIGCTLGGCYSEDTVVDENVQLFPYNATASSLSYGISVNSSFRQHNDSRFICQVPFPRYITTQASGYDLRFNTTTISDSNILNFDLFNHETSNKVRIHDRFPSYFRTAVYVKRYESDQQGINGGDRNGREILAYSNVQRTGYDVAKGATLHHEDDRPESTFFRDLFWVIITCVIYVALYVSPIIIIGGGIFVIVYFIHQMCKSSRGPPQLPVQTMAINGVGQSIGQQNPQNFTYQQQAYHPTYQQPNGYQQFNDTP